MAQPATIFIPDISGYTRFLTTTEITHASHIINELLEIIVRENNELFEIGEIEGDAVLMHRSGDPPRLSELNQHCLKIFRAFHEYLKIIERDRLCNCGACTNASNLNLKFIVHYGDITTINVGGFRKASGLDLIVAHRMLKNGISEDAYIMYSKALTDAAEKEDGWDKDLRWNQDSETYEAIGQVDYSYSSLEEIKNSIPTPPSNQEFDPEYLEEVVTVDVSAPLTDVYQKLLDPRTKEHWVGALKEVKTEVDIDRINTSHICVLEGATAEIKMVGGTTSDQEITLIDQATVPEMNLKMFNYYKLLKTDDSTTHIDCRMAPAQGQEFAPEIAQFLVESRRTDLQSFKEYCESV